MLDAIAQFQRSTQSKHQVVARAPSLIARGNGRRNGASASVIVHINVSYSAYSQVIRVESNITRAPCIHLELGYSDLALVY